MSETLTVSQVNEYIKGLLDVQPLLNQITIRGEASNYRMYPSGHHYFTLKDAEGVLKCVMFKGDASKLRFKPQDGMKLLATGRISVFPRDGQYQLYCRQLVPDGLGDLSVAFEQLKMRLAGEGLFDPEHKKPLPVFPHTIGLITSSAGAAVRDMLRILRARWPLAEVKILPVRVQGEEAPPEIAAAIKYANQVKLADVLIVGRGGGSLEDLWAFNDERVAYAIYQSQIPIISAVGHEPDITISDYVADLRAATPSNGAELAVPDLLDWKVRLTSRQERMAIHMSRTLSHARSLVKARAENRSLRSPLIYYEDKRMLLDHVNQRLSRATATLVTLRRNRFLQLAGKLDALSPLKVLSRGYTIAFTKDGHPLRQVADTHPHQEITLRLTDGTVHCTVNNPY